MLARRSVTRLNDAIVRPICAAEIEGEKRSPCTYMAKGEYFPLGS